MPFPDEFKKSLEEFIPVAMEGTGDVQGARRDLMTLWVDPEFFNYRSMVSGVLASGATKGGPSAKSYVPNYFALLGDFGSLAGASDPMTMGILANGVRTRIGILEEHEVEIDAAMRR